MTGPENPRPGRIEFWFDFASGYAYFGAHDLSLLAARQGVLVVCRPHMLGAAFKVTGVQGLSSTPLKSDYAKLDWQRIARMKGLCFDPPDGHPRSSLLATRVFYWIEKRAPDVAGSFVLDTFNAYYGECRDISDPETVVEIAENLGFSRDAVMQGVADPEIKAIARAYSDEAVERGVFGSPFFFVDDEPFWGWDRLPMIDQWISQGGW